VTQVTFRTISKVKRSKVKVVRPLNAVTENQQYVRKGKAYCSNFKLGIWKEYDDPHHRLVR